MDLFMGKLDILISLSSFDDEYQRKRQEEQNRKPQNFGGGMARGVRGMEGARDGGVGGFAKGVGKGLFGAVIRPVSGTVDLASGTLNAIKICVSGSQYTEPARPKRFIHGDKIIRPYTKSLLARDGGVGGFAKRIEKELFGAVIRPVSGTVDLASGTLNAIKTCVSGSQYTEPARPKRFIHGDKIIRPYTKSLLGTNTLKIQKMDFI
uniref:ATG_C domain-containing protein n=1 Tax=Rhabditophanes sp. KR3021 TaxID=114890 RepID=A0AC35UF97_9BILA